MSEWCAPSMGANLWGGSPLWEYRLGLMVSRITTSRRQGQPREGLSGGSLSAKVRGDGQKTKFQRRLTCTQVTSQLNRIVKAEGCEARWHMAAKPTGTRLAGRASGPALRQASTVHWTVDVRAQLAVNAALVHRQFAHLPGEICAPWRCSTDGRNGRVVPYPKQPGARSRSPISSERIGPDPSDRTARPAVMHGVRPQKSADAVVGGQASGH